MRRDGDAVTKEAVFHGKRKGFCVNDRCCFESLFFIIIC